MSGYDTRFPYPCYQSTAPDPGGGNVRVVSNYIHWTSNFVTASGAPVGRRVRRGAEDNNDTVSEGMAWGMLLAAYVGDKALFDDLWRYAQHYFMSRLSPGRAPLMHWRIRADGQPIDQWGNPTTSYGSATDADEDMALALLVADVRWGGYAAAARSLIDNIMRYDVEPNTWVLKPGDSWGGSSVTNPSYFAPGYYRAFRSVTGDARWDNVVNTTYQMIANLNARRGNSNGLLPDWMTSSGAPVPNMSYNYTYDATRVPWRLAKDAAWFCTDTRARAQLDQLNGFFRGIGAANIVDGYYVPSGARLGSYHSVAFVGPVGAGSITSTDQAYKDALFNETSLGGIRPEDPGAYYNNALKALSILFMAGNMPSPVDPLTRGRWVDDFEVNQGSNWWTYNDPSSTVTKTAEAGRIGRGMRVNYNIASGGWGGAGTSFSPPRNWSGYQALDFWLAGPSAGGSPCHRLEIQENKNPAYPPDQDTAERWEFLFNTAFIHDGSYQYYDVPFSALRRRQDWQPAGAPNDGLTLTQVWGISISPIPPSAGGYCSSGYFRLDRVELVPR